MPDAHPAAVLDYVRRLVATRQAAALTDRELLRRFHRLSDEDAFAALLRRHGPMVLRVCRSLLPCEADAEDAFQAAFVALADKAGTLCWHESVAGWLHQVARRVALKARAAAARRRVCEGQAAHRLAGESALKEVSLHEAQAVLHEELGRLPAGLRQPLVLCYLEGTTQEEAAGQLGWTLRTLQRRLQRGRELLRHRLERRGLGLAAGLGAVALTEHALAGPLPVALAAAALRAVCRSGETTAAGTVARSVLGPLVSVTVRAVSALLLVAAALAGGAAILSRGLPQGEPSPPTADSRTAGPVPRADRHGDPLPEGAVARLGTVRFNHGDGLSALYFTPDGKTILSEGNGSLRFWDAVTGKELKHFVTARPSFDDQTVQSPDGKTLTFLNQENESDTLRVWDLARGKEVRAARLGVRRNEISVFRRNVLSRDGRLCALHLPKQIRVFDVLTAKERYTLPNEDDQIRAVVFAGADRLVTADKQQVLRVYEARTGQMVRQFAHGAPVEVLAASPDGRRLATLEHHTYAIDGFLERDVVHVWDLTTGTRKHTLAARPMCWYMAVQFSPDSTRLLATAAGLAGHDLTVWDAETGRRVREFRGAPGMALAVSPDGRRLAEGVGPGKFDLWDLATGRRLSDADSGHARAATVFLAPAGDRAFTLGYSSISTWDTATARRLHSFDVPPYPYTDPRRDHSPDGRYALTFAGDFAKLRLLVWDLAAGRLLHTLHPPGAPSQLTSAFSPDSSLLAVWHPGKETVIRLWAVRSGQEVRSFPESKAGWPGKLSFSANGQTLFVAGKYTVGYDVATGKELFSWRLKPLPINSGAREIVGGRPVTDDDRLAWRALTVSPDGTTAACILAGGDFREPRVPDRIVLCEARTGKVIRRWSDSGQASRWWEQLAFSRDGRLLTSSDGKVVHVWEVATGKEVCTFRGHRGEVQSLAFSANGRRLASASTDSTVLIWDLPLALGCAGTRTVGSGEKEVTAWWADLAGADAARAQAAIWRLARSPGASVPFLRRHLKPVAEAEVKEIRRLVTDLDAGAFAVRERAFRQLKALGPAAEAALREALEKKVSLEMRRRVEQLLDGLRNRPMAGEPLRTVRALAVLEQAGTPESGRLLRALAEGAPGGWLTGEARAAFDRLGREPPRQKPRRGGSR
jgi:RNA polymerase sigma factor (sigma-70 family)